MFDNNALMKAAGVGVGLGIVLAIGNVIPLVNIICCCIGWLLFIGAGAAYGYFVEQSGGPIDMGSFALGGAITGAAGGFVLGIANGLLSIVMTMAGFGAAGTSQMLDFMEQMGGELPAGYEDMMMTSVAEPDMMTMIISLITSMCIGFIFNAVWGAIGGAIFAGVKGRDSGTGGVVATDSPPDF